MELQNEPNTSGVQANGGPRMKSTVEKTSSLSRKLSVNVPQEEVSSAFSRVFKSIQQDVTLKGFRKGKAPLSTIRNLYGSRVTADVAQDLIQTHYIQALKEHSLDPIGYPNFEFTDPSEGKDFAFTVVFDVHPEVVLKKIEGLDVEKEKLVLDEAKVAQVLENIRSSRASTEDVSESRPAQNGDIAVIDFEGFVDGAPLENGKGTQHNLELGANQFIEGFEEGVVGMQINDEKTLNLKFPNPYHAAQLAGKEVQFKVKLQGLKKRVLPELTDEFLQSIGAPGNLDSLKDSIRKDLEQTETKRIEDAFRNRLLKALVKNNPVEVPPSLLKEQKEALLKDFRKRMEEQGLNESEFADYAAKWDSDFATTASDMIQSSFLVTKIAEQFSLACTDDDINTKFEEYARQTGIEIEKIRAFYNKPEQMSRMTYTITEEKVVAHLLKTVKIKEVDASALKGE